MSVSRQKSSMRKDADLSTKTDPDDYSELTQQDFDRAVKRRGLKLLPEDKENPFAILARQAIEESQAGKTVTCEDFERQRKKMAFRESRRKSMKRLKNT